MEEELSSIATESEASDQQITLASKTSRIIAFLLDLTLIGTFLVMLLTTFIVPRYYSGAVDEFQQLLSEYTDNAQLSQSDLIEQFSPQVKEMFQTSQTVIVFGLWAYFAFSEILMGGGSLGKRVVSIKVINANTLKQPGFIDSILRAGLKTLALLALFPVLIINFFLIFFTKKNQAGHDFLTRTLVVDNNPNLEHPSE